MTPAGNRFDFVIFDLDGTLIDAFEDIAAAANFIRARNNMPPLGVDKVKQHVGHGARYLVEEVLENRDTAFIDDNLQALVGYYEGLEESAATIYDGVIETLSHLRSLGVRTAIASNKPHSVTVKVVKHLGLDTHFDFVQGEQAEIKRKPAPDALLKLVSDAGTSLETTLMVGDSEIDIAAAKAANVKVAAVTYGQHTSDQLRAAGADYLIPSMHDLVSIVAPSLK